MTILYWLIIFFVSLTIPSVIRFFLISITLRKRNIEGNFNSINKTAIELAFSKKNKYQILCEINLDEDRGPLDGGYNAILYTITIGEQVAAGKRITDISELYHELGHAHYYMGMDPSEVGKFAAERTKDNMKVPMRSAISIFLFIIMVCALLMRGYGYLVAAICGITGIVLFSMVLKRQFATIDSEKHASNMALQWMAEDGFSTSEMEQAHKYLNSMLATYKISILHNVTKNIFFVLCAMFGK